jgi:hypothetical protein
MSGSFLTDLANLCLYSMENKGKYEDDDIGDKSNNRE